MKMSKVLFGIPIFIVAAGLVIGLAGCGKSGGLVGTWKGKDFSGDAITTEYQGAEAEMEYHIDGDTLTIDVMGYGIEFERVG
jgi:hypothetical protein